MKNYIFSACLLLFFASSLFASENKDSVKNYDFALLFSVKDLNRLESNNFDVGLGVQFELKKNEALRILGGFNVFNQTTPKPDNAEKDLVHSESAFSFEPMYRLNLLSKPNLFLYTGLLGMIQWKHTEDQGYNFKDVTVEESVLSIGGGICLGAEWFLFDGISLAAEYQLILRGDKNYKSITDGSNTQSSIMPFTMQLNLGSSNTRFIFGFHF